MTGFNDQDRRGHSLVSGTRRPPSLHPHAPAAGLLCSQRPSALGEGCLAGEAEEIPLHSSWHFSLFLLCCFSSQDRRKLKGDARSPGCPGPEGPTTTLGESAQSAQPTGRVAEPTAHALDQRIESFAGLDSSCWCSRIGSWIIFCGWSRLNERMLQGAAGMGGF